MAATASQTFIILKRPLDSSAGSVILGLHVLQVSSWRSLVAVPMLRAYIPEALRSDFFSGQKMKTGRP